MKREDYLLELKNNLGSLSPQEVQDVLDYFTEYFEEKNDDEKVIAELGSPLEAAREILKNMEKTPLLKLSRKILTTNPKTGLMLIKIHLKKTSRKIFKRILGRISKKTSRKISKKTSRRIFERTF